MCQVTAPEVLKSLGELAEQHGYMMKVSSSNGPDNAAAQTSQGAQTYQHCFLLLF